MQGRSVGQFFTAGAAICLVAAVGCASSGGSGSGSSGGTGSEFREDPIGGESRSGVSSSSGSELETVYFDYNVYMIRSDAKPMLRKNAQAINRNEDWGVITIEGYCDERGSDEYNLALGERRANGVRRYLVDLGVPGARLNTVSFGEAKPAVMGHDESAWRYNRRSEFATGR